jgi:hypothetical protein
VFWVGESARPAEEGDLVLNTSIFFTMWRPRGETRGSRLVLLCGVGKREKTERPCAAANVFDAAVSFRNLSLWCPIFLPGCLSIQRCVLPFCFLASFLAEKVQADLINN